MQLRIVRSALPSARPARRRGPIAPALFGGARGGRRNIYPYERSAFGDVPVYGQPFPAAVEQWRDILAAQAGSDIPVDFMLAWIDIESGGNACNYTTSTGSQEVGAFQLMSPGNTSAAGTTVAQLRPTPPCSSANTGGGGGVATFAAMTQDQLNEQVRSGVQYIRYCMSYVDTQLANAGYAGQPGWTNSDWSYWALVKWVHIAPAYIPSMLQAGLAGAGGVPADFNDMIQYATTPKPANWVTNATAVGAFGAGGGSILGVFKDPLIAYVGLAAGAAFLWYLTRRQAG